MKIDWTIAPADAVYHACEQDGSGNWYSAKPFIGTTVWWPKRGTGCLESDHKLPAGADWKESLTKRPKETK